MALETRLPDVCYNLSTSASILFSYCYRRARCETAHHGAQSPSHCKSRRGESQKNRRSFYVTSPRIPGIAPEDAIRQLTAVELKEANLSESGELWINVPQADREQIKARLLEVVLAESSNIVRRAGARVIAAFASIDIPNQ